MNIPPFITAFHETAQAAATLYTEYAGVAERAAIAEAHLAYLNAYAQLLAVWPEEPAASQETEPPPPRRPRSWPLFESAADAALDLSLNWQGFLTQPPETEDVHARIVRLLNQHNRYLLVFNRLMSVLQSAADEERRHTPLHVIGA